MKIPAPLRPWGWALAWLALLWAGATCFMDWYDRLWQARVREPAIQQRLRDDRASLVIGLGDSLVGASLPADYPRHTAQDERIVWVRRWASNASWEDFEALPQALENGPSALVLVEDGILIRRSESKYLPQRLRSALASAGRVWLRRGTFSVSADELLQEAAPQCEPVRAERPQALADPQLGIHYPEREALSAESLRFLRRLRQSAGRVAVIHLPRAASVEAGLEPAQEGWLRRLEELLQREGIDFVRLGEALPDDHYCDGRHPNEQGRRVRVGQFNDVLERMLPSIR